MSFKLEFREPVHKDLFKDMKKRLPKGVFIDQRFEVVPYTVKKSPLVLTTENTGNPVSIELFQFGDLLQTSLRNAKNISIVPTNRKTLFHLNLSQGLNLIRATDKATNQVSEIVLNALHYATLLFSYSREFFNNVKVGFDKQELSVFSPVSVRLAERLLGPFETFIPEIHSLQILSSKFIIKSLISKSASSKTVKEMLAGMISSTPHFQKIEKDFDLDFDVDHAVNYQEEKSGHITHCWIPSFKTARWQALVKLAENLMRFSVEKVSEREIILKDFESGKLHRFDFDDDKDNSFIERQEESTGFDNLVLNGSLETLIDLFFQISYPHDLFIGAQNPLGLNRGALDSSISLDSSLSFDKDPIDPLHNGFLGLSLTGRFEALVKNANDFSARPTLDSGIPLDSSTPLDQVGALGKGGFDATVQKARLDTRPEAVYVDGYFTQGIAQIGSTVTVSNPVTMTMSGSVISTRDNLDQGISLDQNVPFDDFSGTTPIP